MDLKEIMSEIRKFLEIAAGKFFTDAELAQFPHRWLPRGAMDLNAPAAIAACL